MREKLKRFEEIKTRANVFDPGSEVYEKIKGNWHTNYFKNENPIVLELGCGCGEFTIGMARLFDDRNFIGVDIKGARIWKGSGLAIEDNLLHLAFLRTDIQRLDKFFDVGEIAAIWIVFPDPRPKDRDAKKRLVSPRFLDLYKQLIQKTGIIYLKTDNTNLFDYTLKILQERDDITNLRYTHDLYHSELEPECFGICTRFEKKFSEKRHAIKYLRFQFRND